MSIINSILHLLIIYYFIIMSYISILIYNFSTIIVLLITYILIHLFNSYTHPSISSSIRSISTHYPSTIHSISISYSTLTTTLNSYQSIYSTSIMSTITAISTSESILVHIHRYAKISLYIDYSFIQS